MCPAVVPAVARVPAYTSPCTNISVQTPCICVCLYSPLPPTWSDGSNEMLVLRCKRNQGVFDSLECVKGNSDGRGDFDDIWRQASAVMSAGEQYMGCDESHDQSEGQASGRGSVVELSCESPLHVKHPLHSALSPLSLTTSSRTRLNASAALCTKSRSAVTRTGDTSDPYIPPSSCAVPTDRNRCERPGMTLTTSPSKNPLWH